MPSPAGSACNNELGMQSFWVQDADITASSIRDNSHDPGQARLHGNGAWMPLIQDASQFLQVDFKTEVTVSAVAIQGHPSYEYWVTRYSLLFSFDGKAWEGLSEVNGGKSLSANPRLSIRLFCSHNTKEWSPLQTSLHGVTKCAKTSFAPVSRDAFQIIRLLGQPSLIKLQLDAFLTKPLSKEIYFIT